MSNELINCNSANYNNTSDWSGLDGNLTSVGSNGKSSFFGTYDQNGNIKEILDSLNGSYNVLRGGAFDSSLLSLQNTTRESHFLDIKQANTGFRIAKNINNSDTYSNFITVSGAPNSGDSTGYGSVSYEYKIQTYPVTNNEYAFFLNAIAVDGASGKDLYIKNLMSDDARGGINRTGSFPVYSYSVKTNMGDKPVNFVNWFNAARFVNWVSNGRQNIPSTTETGVYTLSGSTKVSPNNKNFYWIPDENEWYKAAYYNAAELRYTTYATNSDTQPDSIVANNTGYAIDTSTNPGSCISPTPTPTNTVTITPSVTISPSISLSPSPSPTNTPSLTPSLTSTISLTPSPTNTISPTNSPTNTISRTPTKTPTLSISQSKTPTPTLSLSQTSTPTPTFTPTPTKSLCPSIKIGQLIFQGNFFINDPIDVVYKGFVLSNKIVGQSIEARESPDVTPTPTPSVTRTPTPSVTRTTTPSVTRTPTQTP